VAGFFEAEARVLEFEVFVDFFDEDCDFGHGSNGSEGRAGVKGGSGGAIGIEPPPRPSPGVPEEGENPAGVKGGKGVRL
jgi:hypothetical protein